MKACLRLQLFQQPADVVQVLYLGPVLGEFRVHSVACRGGSHHSRLHRKENAISAKREASRREVKLKQSKQPPAIQENMSTVIGNIVDLQFVHTTSHLLHVRFHASDRVSGSDKLTVVLVHEHLKNTSSDKSSHHITSGNWKNSSKICKGMQA